jgi:hypothetical protein
MGHLNLSAKINYRDDTMDSEEVITHDPKTFDPLYLENGSTNPQIFSRRSTVPKTVHKLTKFKKN